MSVAMEQRPQHGRTRSKSTFSFKSDHSQSSSPSHERNSSASKHERTVSDSYKPHLNTTGKADPNAAMNESQPIAAALEKPTLQSLRSFQHTDKDGNPIVEPDLSNPTRSRWERPLDTIRSFEAAIDNEYRRRGHNMRGDAPTEVMSGYDSRRSSYYGGGGGGGRYDQGRYSQVSGYYGGRQAGRDSWVDSGHGMGGPVGPPRGSRYSRMQSDPGWSRQGNGNGQGNGVYPVQGYQQSRDTVNTNGSNGSHSERYSTELSSENSSIERAAAAMRPDMGEQYGFQGFGGGPILEEYHTGMGPLNNGYAVQPSNGANGYGAPPPVPAKAALPSAARQPIKLTKSNEPPANSDGASAVPQRQNTEKRKSWFKRRFSKD